MSHDRKSSGAVWAWALYDWGNSAFATTVMAGFFPVFFREFWSQGVDASTTSFRLGVANSIASISVAFLAPVLGAIADNGRKKKQFLLLFAASGIAATGALVFVGQGRWWEAACLYGLGILGFSGGNVFYDALIVSVSKSARFDSVSALGYALGYLGGGLLFAINVAMTLKPALFGLEDASEGVRYSFLSAALWWGVFSVPLFWCVHESKHAEAPSLCTAVRMGLSELSATFRHVRRLRPVFLFLVAYWLYIDGVDTVIRMAVDYGLSLGLTREDLILALLITQFIAFPSALVFGRLGVALGAKAGIAIGLGVYVVITVAAYFISSALEFYLLAAGIGLVQGGVQSLSRSLYARIIPQDKAAEFFGFYNMFGKFSAVFGPLLVGGLSLLTQSPRVSILGVLVFFVPGAVLLYFVDDKYTPAEPSP